MGQVSFGLDKPLEGVHDEDDVYHSPLYPHFAVKADVNVKLHLASQLVKQVLVRLGLAEESATKANREILDKAAF